MGGQTLATFVVKATFSLSHDNVAQLAPPVALVQTDADREPTELAPYLPGLGVMLRGHASSPGGRPTRAMSVRLALFRDQPVLDKTLHVFGDRAQGSGELVRMPLVWERAYGGPAVLDNPIGMAVSPNIVDPTHADKPAGFGPIPRAWAARRRMLGAADPALLHAASPDIPVGFDWRYLHAAPLDQQIRPLRGDEWIVLDGMHPDLPRIQSRLPAARARARVCLPGEPPRDLELAADTIFIDADRGLCSVLFRDHLEIRSVELEDIEAHAGLELPEQPILWPSGAVSKRVKYVRPGKTLDLVMSPVARSPLPFAAPDPAAPPRLVEMREPPEPSLSTGTVAIDLRKARRKATPFDQGEPPPPPLGQGGDTPPVPPYVVAERPMPPDTVALPPPPPSIAIEPSPAPELPATPPPIVAAPPPPPLVSSMAPSSPTPDEAKDRPVPSLPRDEGLRTLVTARLRAGESLADLPLSGADLSDLDLGGAVFAGCDLRGADLSRSTLDDAQLACASLRGATLSGAVLVGADLSSADLVDTRLEGARFDRARLSSADLSSARGARASFVGASAARAVFAGGAWDDAVFDSMEGAGADFKGASIGGASFRRAAIADVRLGSSRGAAIFDDASMPRASVAHAELQGGSFVGVDATGSSWRDADLDRASLRGAKLALSIFEGARCREAIFDGADLEGADLQRIDATGARFEGASLEGANLRQAIMREAHLGGAKMRGAILYKASLARAEIVGADLREANLRATDLEGAKLAKAKLDGADLRGANLAGADITGASREAVKGIGA